MPMTKFMTVLTQKLYNSNDKVKHVNDFLYLRESAEPDDHV